MLKIVDKNNNLKYTFGEDDPEPIPAETGIKHGTLKENQRFCGKHGWCKENSSWKKNHKDCK